jgi:hypothetical protein
MTLKDRFDMTMVSFLIEPKQDATLLDHFEKLTDEYAIEFAEFIGKKTINYQDGKFRMKTLTPVLKTPEEILEIYKKEKGL